MKINLVYINREGVPMVSKTGWPKMPPHNSTLHDYAAQVKLFNNALEQAKRDAVPLIITGMLPTSEVIGPDEKFIEVDIEVEFVQQMMNPDNKWIDCFGNSHNISWYTSLRWVARVVPAKQDIAVEREDAAHIYASQEGFEEGGSDYLSSSLKTGDIYTWVHDAFEAGARSSKQQLAAAQERVKELETETKHMKSLLAKYAENE